MRQPLIGILLLASLSTAGARADDKDKDKPKPDSPAQQLQALFAEHQKASTALYKPVEDAKTPEEQEKVVEKEKIPEKFRKLHAEYARRVLDFAAKHPTERKLVGDALAWIVRNDASTPEAAKAIDAIIRDHLNDKNQEIDRLLSSLCYDVTEPGERLLRVVAEKAEDKERRIQGRYFLALNLKNRAEGINLAKVLDEKIRKQVEQLRGKQYLDWMASGDPAKFLKEAENLYEALAKDSGDVKVFNQTIKELVASELFEIRNLAIGKVAPEIEGEDINGKSFKLRDYRGKVVVLDFWGHW
jgi:predicted protein tyrosine phosphatase